MFGSKRELQLRTPGSHIVLTERHRSFQGDGGAQVCFRCTGKEQRDISSWQADAAATYRSDDDIDVLTCRGGIAALGLRDKLELCGHRRYVGKLAIAVHCASDDAGT